MRQSAASEVHRVIEQEAEKDRAKANLKSIKTKKLKPYSVPADPFRTVFWCATHDKGVKSINDYLIRKQYVK